MNPLGSEFKVGLLVISSLILIGYMSVKVSNKSNFIKTDKEAWFLLDNAAGIVNKSGVKMAGIDVGIIEEIQLQNGKARINISYKDDLILKKSATIEVKSSGILGDRYIEINPGKETDPELENGEQIVKVIKSGDLGTVMTEVSKITKNFSEVADILKQSVSEDGEKKHILGRIIINIENLTSDLSEITGKNKDDINQMIENFHSVADGLNNFINNESEDGFKSTWQQVRISLAKLDRSLNNIEEITEKINKGEGSIGRLVNDEQTVDELNNAIEGVGDFFNSAQKMQTSIDFHTSYLANIESYKSAFGIKIQPGLDRYYQIQIVDDPMGLEKITETEAERDPGGSFYEHETKRYKSEVKFTVLFAKNFYDFTIRGGIIESTGGIGFDYFLWNKKMQLSLELFDFSYLNLRPLIKYNFLKGVYLMGGIDDSLDKRDNFSTYIGAGIFLTNDDLKALAAKAL